MSETVLHWPFAVCSDEELYGLRLEYFVSFFFFFGAKKTGNRIGLSNVIIEGLGVGCIPCCCFLTMFPLEFVIFYLLISICRTTDVCIGCVVPERAFTFKFYSTLGSGQNQM